MFENSALPFMNSALHDLRTEQAFFKHNFGVRLRSHQTRIVGAFRRRIQNLPILKTFDINDFLAADDYVKL